MNCPYCGAGNPTGGKFCRRCGKPLAILEAEKPAKKAEDPAERAKLFLPCNGSNVQRALIYQDTERQ